VDKGRTRLPYTYEEVFSEQRTFFISRGYGKMLEGSRKALLREGEGRRPLFSNYVRRRKTVCSVPVGNGNVRGEKVRTKVNE